MIVIYFLLMMLPIVVIHELGHFYVGKWMGIRPEVFSVGFGPELFSRKAKDGTIWRFAAIPAGGYVKFAADANGTNFPSIDVDKPSYLAKFRAKIATILAGPFTNFAFSILAFFIYAVSYGLQGNEPVIERVRFVESQLQTGDKILSVNGQSVSDFNSFYENSSQGDAYVPAQVERGDDVMNMEIPNPALAVVMGVDPALPAFKSGIKIGDRIINYGGQSVTRMSDLSAAVDKGGANAQDVQVLRDGETLTLNVTPAEITRDDGSIDLRLGVYSGIYEAKHVPLSVTNSLKYAVSTTFWIVTASYDGIKDLITGRVGLDALSGPVGIGRMAADSADSGFWKFFWTMGLMSSAIGFMNLLPIPILDGGHIVLMTYEKITGKLPPQLLLNGLFALGFAFLIGLMSLATVQDLFG